MAEDPAVVDGAIGADLSDQGRVDEGGVQASRLPHVAESLTPSTDARAGGSKVLGDQAGGIRAQGDGPTDRAQSAVGVVAAWDEELRAGQGAGSRRRSSPWCPVSGSLSIPGSRGGSGRSRA